MNKSKKILYFAVCFLLGIAIQEIIVLSFFILYSFFLFFILLLIFFGRSPQIKFIIFLFLFFIFGASRISWTKMIYNNHYLKNYQATTFVGFVQGEPENRNNYKKVIVQEEKEKTKFLLQVSLFSQISSGDKIKFSCQPIKASSHKKYGKYLKKQKINYSCFPAKVVVLSKGKGLYNYLLKLKQKSRKIINKNVFYPESGVLSAMLLGYKKDVPTDLKEIFSQAGISHLVAISGMHLAIVSFILYWFFIEIGFWRQQVFYLLLFLLWFYIALVGWPASAVRSGIMISVVLWGRHIGRVNNLKTTLFLVASFILLFNPFYLLNDIGFQLSFLALLGIINLTPFFLKMLDKIIKSNGVKDILAVTLSAQVYTLPLVVFYFGFIPLLSLLINLIFIPLLPIIFVAGLIIIFLGFWFSGLASILGIVVWIFLNFLLSLVSFLISLPLSYLYIAKVNFFWIGLCYLFLFFLNLKIAKQNIYNELI